MDNLNTSDYLRKIKNSVIENIRRTGAPSVQMTDVPREPLLNGMDSDAEDEAADLDADEHSDVRQTQLRNDKNIARIDELEESDDEELEPNGSTARRPTRKNRITDYINPYADKDGPDDDADFVMSGGANGRPADEEDDDEEEAAKDLENVDPEEDDDGASAESSPRPSRVSLSKPQLWSAATEMAPHPDADLGDEMDIDDEDLGEEDKDLPDLGDDEPPNGNDGPSEEEGSQDEDDVDEAAVYGPGGQVTPPESPQRDASVTAVAATENDAEDEEDVEMEEDVAPAATYEGDDDDEHIESGAPAAEKAESHVEEEA
jgi:histone deacetylase 1/2